MNPEIKQKMNDYIKLVEENLDKFIPVEYPEKIWESMRYSVLAGGKRLRPILVLETCRVLSGTFEQAIPAACAIEMLHSQSLIHDDLPGIDNTGGSCSFIVKNSLNFVASRVADITTTFRSFLFSRHCRSRPRIISVLIVLSWASSMITIP